MLFSSKDIFLNALTCQDPDLNPNSGIHRGDIVTVHTMPSVNEGSRRVFFQAKDSEEFYTQFRVEDILNSQLTPKDPSLFDLVPYTSTPRTMQEKLQSNLDLYDRYYLLRKDLWRNIEPQVVPLGCTQVHSLEAFAEQINQTERLDSDELEALYAQYAADGISTECWPALVAQASREAKLAGIEEFRRLNRDLISWHHDTPLESTQFVFLVKGISKSLAGQYTRHRSGIGFVFRSTRYISYENNSFVYPACEWISHEDTALDILKGFELAHEDSMIRAKQLIQTSVPCSSPYEDKVRSKRIKEMARRFQPVDFATSAYVFCNVRAMRHFFELRLAPSAEWEISRLAHIMALQLLALCPSLFEDMANIVPDYTTNPRYKYLTGGYNNLPPEVEWRRAMLDDFGRISIFESYAV